MKATSIRLNDKREASLTDLARRLGCEASSGQPSWRVMLSMIADGFLKVSNPMNRTQQVFINFKRPPGWWKPDENESMLAADVAKKYKTTVEILEEKGFVIDGDRIFPGNWKGWRPEAEAKKKKSSSATPPAADDESFRRNLERNLERSAIPEPDWFVRSPVGAAVMLLEEAMVASKMEADEIVAHGFQIIDHNGQRLVTGPAGSDWDFNALCPP